MVRDYLVQEERHDAVPLVSGHALEHLAVYGVQARREGRLVVGAHEDARALRVRDAVVGGGNVRPARAAEGRGHGGAGIKE